MLTKQQIKDLPKGEYLNKDLHNLYSNHGKKSRVRISTTNNFEVRLINRKQSRQE